MALKIKGRGCIEAVRKGVWRVRFCLGRDPLHPGRYPYSPSRMAYGTKSEAYRVADEYKRELEDENVINPDEPMVREYAQLFRDQHVAKIKSPLAYERERQTINHIDELFGDYRLEELSPIIIKATYAKARDEMSARWLSLDAGTIERLARWRELQPMLYPVKNGEDDGHLLACAAGERLQGSRRHREDPGSRARRRTGKCLGH